MASAGSSSILLELSGVKIYPESRPGENVSTAKDCDLEAR
jgi:hypothetical protein